MPQQPAHLRVFDPAKVTLKGKRVSLIGGAGFIGHNLALELVSRGAEVQVVDSLQVNNLMHIASQPQLENQSLYLQMLHERLRLLNDAGIRLDTIDARDYMKLTLTLNDFQPNTVVQLAAVAHANRSNKDPYNTFDHSLRTLENALDWSRGSADHFVYFSSSMVYGNFESPVIDETHPMNPLGIYGALKLSGEKIVQAYQQVFGLPYTIIRPAALYGPRCVSRRVGQIFIENGLMGKQLKVEGDGEECIDFTCIDDLVQGICCVIERPEARNETFNMTYGEARSIRQLLDVIREEIPEIEVIHKERDHLRPFRGSMSVDKAKELIGYAPSNPVEVGFPKYVEWYRSIGLGAEGAYRKAA